MTNVLINVLIFPLLLSIYILYRIVTDPPKIVIKRVLIFLLLLSIYILYCVVTDPPTGETFNRDPQTYLETNRYVLSHRKDYQEKGRLHFQFLPRTIENETDVKYLFWYECSFLGENPKYAITLSIPYSDRESYQVEYERLTQLQDFSLFEKGDTTVISCNVFPAVLGYLEEPIHDGLEYTMEYAIADEKKLTITYTELWLIEGQKCCEDIISQLQFLGSMAASIGMNDYF